MTHEFFTIVKTPQHGTILLIEEELANKKVVIVKRQGPDKKIYTKIIRFTPEFLEQTQIKPLEHVSNDLGWVKAFDEQIEGLMANDIAFEKAKKLG